MTSPPSPGVIVVSANTLWNLFNFRIPILQELASIGFRVVAAAADDESAEALSMMGIEIESLKMRSRGISPFSDASLFLQYCRLFKRVRPVAFLAFTSKPNIYGSLAAHYRGIPVINTVTGLGTGFLGGPALRFVMVNFYRFALGKSTKIFFHNDDDRNLFLRLGLTTEAQAAVVAGSGVDLEKFAPRPVPSGRPFIFLFIGRMLRDKGAAEFAEAASIVKRQRSARFQMLGPNERHPKGVPAATVEMWRSEGHVELLNPVADVRSIMAEADCVVLPSYREGLPRVLIEASAMAKPVITTDVPGCRQVVEHGVTGLLCDARSSESLAEAMIAVHDLSLEQRLAMGRRGRRRAEREFSQDKIVNAYLGALAQLGINLTCRNLSPRSHVGADRTSRDHSPVQDHGPDDHRTV